MPRRRATPSLTIPTAPGLGWRENALLAATLAVLALTIIQCLVSIAPDIYWDMDPRSEIGNNPVTCFGPAGAAWLCFASMLVAAAALAIHRAAGGALSWLSLVLASLGAAACAYHMPSHSENIFRGSVWIDAASLGIAALHLAQHDRPRRFIAAALAALVVALALNAAWYYWVEHPATVRMFMANRDQFLASEGWAAGSPQELIYERRVMDAEVSGAFGMSNVFGSVVAALTVLAATAATWLATARRWKHALLPAAVMGLGVLTVVLSRSKGAAVTLVMIMGLLAVAALAIKRLTLRRCLAPLAILLIIIAFSAVLLRGSYGPPATVAGERSLFFRSQYWHAAERMMRDGGVPRWLHGIGPASMQELYSRYKDPLNPEEVTSTHNVFIDFITMLGLGGIAWSVMLLLWLYRAGRNALANENPIEPALADTSRTDLVAVFILTAAAFGTQYVMKFQELEFFGALLWLSTAIGFAATMSFLLSPRWSMPSIPRIGLFLAAAVLLVHNQIELTFFHQGAATLAFLVVGAAAGASISNATTQPATKSLRVIAWIIPGIFVAAAIAFAIAFAVPVTQQQETLRVAAARLHSNNLPSAIDLLDQAITELPSNPKPCRWRAQLRFEFAVAAAHAGQFSRAAELVREATTTTPGVTDAVRNDMGLLRAQAQIQEHAAELLREPHRLELALALWKNLAARTPYGMQDHLHLADILWKLDQHDAAREEYRRVLTMNAQSYLDPLRQLSERDEALVNERLKNAATQP